MNMTRHGSRRPRSGGPGVGRAGRLGAAARVVLAAIVLAPASARADWPTHRGNAQRTGNLDGQPAPRTPGVLWVHLSREHFVASPVPGDRAVYAAGIGAFNTGVFYCLSDEAAPARRVLWDSLTASIGASREQSKRLVSAANVKGIVISCLIHANEHKGAWPDAVSQLVRDGSCALGHFDSPFRDQTTMLTVDNVDRESYYLYRPGTGLDPREVVVCERELRGGGANFAYADGHVEWVEGERAVQLLAKMRQLAN